MLAVDFFVSARQGGDLRQDTGDLGAMFFTRVGKVIAYLGLALGFLRCAMGVFVGYASPDMESRVALSRRYFGSFTSGQAIDQGMKFIVIAVALGVLCEISARKSKAGE
ncbi:hypothetical protein [Pleomorphomonas sp. JP5]|uniref:hypothetical protein n=1 Tax=Pleomorphomonas sp. JP5 TaxID=2942998 RepID=UPI0020430B43|nr:hypothetical protein [Pleomorphomonas sp. JP5]MCM5558470.1 hypothetical protein [Pleomorphomonas sp. JP5]